MSSKQLTPFDFNGAPVRVVLIDDEPWFVGADLCRSLKISDARQAVARIDEDDRCLAPVVDSMGRDQQTWVVNESGMYELVLRSDKAEARAFRKWITREVLPQIRKTGSFIDANSDLSAIRSMVDAIEADRARIGAVEKRQDTMESHLAGVLGQYDEFTTLAYAKLNDLPTDRTSCQKHGQRATRLMRERKMNPPRKRQDATFGTVNVYPVEVLEATANQ